MRGSRLNVRLSNMIFISAACQFTVSVFIHLVVCNRLVGQIWISKNSNLLYKYSFWTYHLKSQHPKNISAILTNKKKITEWLGVNQIPKFPVTDRFSWKLYRIFLKVCDTKINTLMPANIHFIYLFSAALT